MKRIQGAEGEINEKVTPREVTKAGKRKQYQAERRQKEKTSTKQRDRGQRLKICLDFYL